MKRPDSTCLLPAALLLGALIHPSAVHAQDNYEYRSIDLPGSEFTQVFGINDRGQVVGTGLVAFSHDLRSGEYTLIDEVAGFDSAAVLGVNNRGDFVGAVTDPGSARQSGLLLDRKGRMTVFDHPGAFSGTTARAISSQGLITGYRDPVEPTSFLAGFIYDPSSEQFTDIVPSLVTIAQGINGRGDVVGSAVFQAEDDPCNSGAPAGSLVRYGWFRSSEGDVLYFTVNGLANTAARGLADSGSITGFAVDAAAGVVAGFVTELGDEQCQDISVAEDSLVVFPGATRTFPQGISNSGVVVGEYSDADGNIHGFVAAPR
jgi:hypothetical protein